MALHYSPRIVTDNLIYYFDPINIKCYPGSGYTFTDLSIYKSPGSLSGLSFDSNEGGFVLSPLSAQPWSPLAGLGPSPPGGYVPYLSAQLVNAPLSGTELTIITTKKFINNSSPNQDFIYDIFSSYGTNAFNASDQKGCVAYIYFNPSLSGYTVEVESTTSFDIYTFYYTGSEGYLPLSGIDFSKISNKACTWALVLSEITGMGKVYILCDDYIKEINLVRENPGSTANIISWSGPRPWRNLLFLNRNYFYYFFTPGRILPSELGTGYTSLSVDITTYNFMMYNKALTPQEIIQNYNALKPRFVL